jgi:glycine/D-amino acid oxidase-like deaminating enzyme
MRSIFSAPVPTGSPEIGQSWPTQRFDVAVVGAGIVGAGIAARLAESGLRVVSLNDGPGATPYSGALIRAYEPDPVMRALATRSSRLVWSDEDAARVYGFHRTGSVVLLGDGDLDTAARALGELTDAGVAARLLDPEEIAGRWPDMSVEGVAGGLWEPGGGYVTPAVAVNALLAQARRAGAQVLAGQRVRRIEAATGGGACLVTGHGTITARAVALAAGVGTPALLGDGAPDADGLGGRRITYALFGYEGRPLPAVVDLVTGLWGRPARDRSFLAGWPFEERDDGADGSTEVPATRIAELRAKASPRWPWLGAAALRSATRGVDLYAPNGPMCGLVSRDPITVVAAGWSGGGFKTAPAAAERAAGLIADAIGADRCLFPLANGRTA